MGLKIEIYLLYYVISYNIFMEETMLNIKYHELKKFEAKIDNKLFSYINSDEKVLRALEKLELNHPYFLEDDNKVAFNMWLSTDFVIEENMTIIDRFLKNSAFKLSPKEIDYLVERKNSHLSVFEIKKFDNEYIYLHDLLVKKDYKLWEPELIGAIDQGEILIARVCRILDSFNFIGDINHLPSIAKTDFLGDILLDFNNTRKLYPQLTIKNYLKEYSLNLYRLYSSTIFSLLDMKDDMDAYLFNELGEFSNFVERKERNSRIKEYSTNLINFYEYYLSDKNLTLSDLDQIHIYDFFTSGIEEGFIDSKTSLNSYISTLVKYIQFLKKKNPKYKTIYNDILDISRNRFVFMEKLVHNDVFHIDKSLVALIQFNPKTTNLIEDFEHFILYIGEKQPELTKKNFIKRRDLFAINEIFNNKYMPQSGAPNQKDFPLIDFFYRCALNLDIIYFYNNFLDLDPMAISFLKSVEEKKYILLFQYFISFEYFTGLKKIDKNKDRIISTLASLSSTNDYGLDDFDSEVKTFLTQAAYYLDLFNLISSKKGLSIFKITNTGKKLFQALDSSSKEPDDSKIIDLESFRNNK